jgi:hypothetical protein
LRDAELRYCFIAYLSRDDGVQFFTQGP